MLSKSDLAQFKADQASIRDDNATAIVLRRDKVNLPAQSVRITRGRPGRSAAGANTSEARADALVFGDTDLDIQIGDRFNANGVLLVITFVRPDRRAGVIAEATLAQ